MKTCELGFPESHVLLAMLSVEDNDDDAALTHFETAEEILRKKAKDGDDHAAVRLGDVYRIQHFAMDLSFFDDAVASFRIAADRNDPVAMCRIADMLLDKDWGTRNLNGNEAERLYTQAADLGCAEGFLGLGKLSLDSDPIQALIFLRKAIDDNNSKALYVIGK